jgi:hypothetical protein
MTEKQTSMTEALCAVRPHIRNARLDKTNPHFKSKYASLAAVLEAIAPFADHGIAVNETIGYDAEGRFVLTTQLSHKGEKVVCVFPLPENLDSQKTGSALTYARRYSLSVICGISSDEDDDGEANRGTKGAHKKPPVKKAIIHVEPSQRAMDFMEAIRGCKSTEDLKAWANIPAVKSDLKGMPDVQAALVRETYVTRQTELTQDLSGAV